MERKKLIKILVAASLSVAIVVGTVVTGFLTNWFGLSLGPMGKLLIAAKNTISADSFILEIDDGYDKTEYRYSRVGNKTAILYDDGWMEGLIYDDKEYYIYEDEGYMNAGSSELSEEYNIVFDTLDDIEEGEEIDWDEIIEAFYLDDIVDDKHMDEFIDTLLKEKLRDKKWLEEYLGFEKDGNNFSFKFKAYETYKELIDIADAADILKEDKADLEETAEDIENITVEAEVIVEKSKLSEIEVVLADKKYDYEMTYSVEFSDYGKSEISKDEIEDFIDEVEKIEEEYTIAHTCDNCGGGKYYGVCDRCDYVGYRYCYDCRSYSHVYNRNGSNYCRTCLYQFTY